jgi:hypothetical protein
MKALTKLWSEMTKPQEELASQEVKLGTIDNVQALNRKSVQIGDDAAEYLGELIDITDRLERVLDESRKLLDEGESVANELASELDKGASAAEALGINPDNIPELDNGLAALDELTYNIQELNDYHRKYR